MEITEVKVNLVNTGDSKLKAFVTVTLDHVFVIRDLKIIDGKKGLFVAMPSVKVATPCPRCKKKNPIRSHYCGECGTKLETPPAPETEEALREEHRDIAHPINTQTRDYLQSKILNAYETERSKTAVHS